MFAAQQHGSGGSSADYSITGTAEVDEENKMIERMAGNTSTKKEMKLQVKNSDKKKACQFFSSLKKPNRYFLYPRLSDGKTQGIIMVRARRHIERNA